VLRDAEALIQIGVPLISQDGARGGYSLPDDYTLPPLQLTRHEAFLLLFAMGGIGTPFASARDTLRAKLRQAIPPGKRDEAEKLAEVVKFTPLRQDRPAPFLEELIAAARERTWLLVRYRSYNGVSEQVIQPHRIHSANGLWYCDAFSHTRGEDRVFRVDRFVSVAKTDARETISPAARLAYGDPSHPEVEIDLSPRAVMTVETEPHFGQMIIVNADGSGKLRFRCPPSEFDWLSRYVLSLGSDATVRAPKSLHTRLRELAEKIVLEYSKR
jgi:predicted DNA-binding transcriptional regulator YafY